MSQAGMMTRAAATALAMLALALLSVPAAAADTLTPLFGGDGGATYALRCPAGTVLTGLTGRSGAWLDQVGPLCSSGRPAGVAVAGGNGGQLAIAPCPGGAHVVAVGVAVLRGDRHYVDRIDLRCAPAGARAPVTATTSLTAPIGASGRDDSLKATLDCGTQDAVGIHGRAGTAVDALGLICGDHIAAAGPGPTTGIAASPPVTSLVRPTAPPAATPGDGCIASFIARGAVPGDMVCVAAATRTVTLRDNATAKYRSATGVVGGACLTGFVWREATPSDLVCVYPETRAQAKADNAAAASRRAR